MNKVKSLLVTFVIMKFSSKLVEDATQKLSSLPGVGKRTALRLLLHMLKRNRKSIEDFGESFINFDMLPSDRKTITILMRENDEIWIEFNHYQDGPRFYKYDTRGFSKLFQTHCKISN